MHDRTIEGALAALDATNEGLSTDEAARRLAEHGQNRLPEPPRRNAVVRFLVHFHNVLIYVLLGASVVTAALGHWVDTGVILAVVIVNGVIGFVQEGRAEEEMAAISGMLAPNSAVLRDGQRVSVDAVDLVPGDIVMVEARGLKAEEAMLTGESVPVDKATAPVSVDAPLADQTSMVFSFTVIPAGPG